MGAIIRGRISERFECSVRICSKLDVSLRNESARVGGWFFFFFFTFVYFLSLFYAFSWAFVL